MTLYNDLMRFGLLIIIAIVSVFPSIAVAQLMGGSTEAFSVSVSPQYPKPQSQATISILSSALDLDNSTMIVSINNKESYRGNVQSIPIQLGGVGNTMDIKVTISTASESYSQTLSIQPQDVYLVMEPISSSPPLYPGKSLVPLEGNVRIVAIANMQDAKGKTVNTSDLSYSWMVDDTHLTNSSGIGKSAIVVDSPMEYRSRSVSVTVQNQNGSIVGGDSISLTSQQPSVQIYKNDPLLGILFNRALLDSHTITGSEDVLYAAPFSFPISNNLPTIQWFLNGEQVQEGNLITLRPTGDGEGTASISLISSVGESVRAAENLLLYFGSSIGNSLFGI